MKNGLRSFIINTSCLMVGVGSLIMLVIAGSGLSLGYAPRTTFNALTSFTCPDSDALSSAAARSLPLSFFGSENRLSPEYVQKVASLEAWAETVEDRCTRIAYLNWVDYFRRDIEKQKRMEAIARNFPKPPG